MPTCSVIVHVRDESALTFQCLDALLAHPLQNTDVEIILVGELLRTDTHQLQAAYGDVMRIVAPTTAGGVAAAWNDGAASALGTLFVFLSSHTVPRGGWLDALLSYAEEHPASAIVGSKLVIANDAVQHAGVVICQDRYPRNLYTGFPADHPAVNKSRRFQIVSTIGALVRREPFRQVGGFDLSFDQGYEDVDLCLRLGECGFEVHYCHDSVIEQLGAGCDRLLRPSSEPSAQLNHNRWATRLHPDDLHYYLEDGLLQVSYGEQYPVALTISPLLAVPDSNTWERQAGQLLRARSQRVLDLLQEILLLKTRVREIGYSEGNGFGDDTPSRGQRASAEPKLLSKGQAHPLSAQPSDRLVSVLLPVKNGAEQLRQLLPRILSQRSPHNVEIVAIDSGSDDDTVGVLKQFSSTVVSIPPESFNPALTRNLAATHAKGEVYVFVTKYMLPADEHWLANLVAPLEADPRIAGVCSRVLPPDDADVLTRRDGLSYASASAERSVREITNWAEYQTLSPLQLRLFINFHTVGAAIRSDVFAQIPLRESTTIEEDVQWGKEVLESGFKIQHEPSAIVFHAHNDSYFDLFGRNVDDGIANRKAVGLELDTTQVVPSIFARVRDDWHYLEQTCGLEGPELEHWQLVSALRRTAQIVGQWIGVNYEHMPANLARSLSLSGRTKAGLANPGHGTAAL